MFLKKSENLTSKNLLKIKFFKKIKNLTSKNLLKITFQKNNLYKISSIKVKSKMLNKKQLLILKIRSKNKNFK